MKKLELLVVLLFHIQGAGMQVLLNFWEILVKELYIHSMHSSLSESLCSQFNYPWCSSK